MEWIELAQTGREEAIKRAVTVLAKGGVIVFPAERLYGLGADATCAAAIKRIFHLKGRDAGEPLPVIVENIDMARKYVEFDRESRLLAEKLWPGPLTLVLPLIRTMPRELTGGLDSLAVRSPGEETARLLASSLGGPVTATSSNLSGKASGRLASEAVADLAGEVDLALDAGELAGPPGSTVARVAGGKLEVLREGAVSLERLESTLKGF